MPARPAVGRPRRPSDGERAHTGRALVRIAAALSTVAATTAAAPDTTDHPPRAPMTLADALAEARAHDESYRLVDGQRALVAHQRDRAWAALLPALSVRGSYTHADKQVAVGTRVIQLQDYFAASAQAQLALVKGPAIPELLRSQRADQAAEHSAAWARAALDFEVARAFVACLAADNLTRAAERAVSSADEHVAAVRARRAAGEAIAVDESRAQAERVTAQGALIRARNAQVSSADLLAFLTGAQPPVVLQAASTTVQHRADGSERPDLAAARSELSAAEVAELAVWLSYLPTLSLGGVYALNQNAGWSGDPSSWNVMLTLEWVLFDGGLRRADRLDRATRRELARLRLQQLERAAAQELRQAMRDRDTALSSLATADEQLALARQTRGMVLQRYLAGLATSLELLDADDAAQRAEVNQVASALDLELRSLDVLRAQGLDPMGRRVGSTPAR
jgi:outer membrane protein TolC